MSGSSSRGNPRLGDIVRSVLVLGLVVLVVFGVTRLYTVTPDQPTSTVDYQQAVASARPAADFALLAPQRLPDGWRATSARFTPDTWQLGVVTDDDQYVGLRQVPQGEAAAVARYAEGSTRAGTVDIDGETWTRYDDPDGDTVLVQRAAGTTTLVVTTLSLREVTPYVASLSAS